MQGQSLFYFVYEDICVRLLHNMESCAIINHIIPMFVKCKIQTIKSSMVRPLDLHQDEKIQITIKCKSWPIRRQRPLLYYRGIVRAMYAQMGDECHEKMLSVRVVYPFGACLPNSFGR